MPEKLVLTYPGGLDTSTTFDQTRPEGFIEIWAMPAVVAYARKREHPTRPTQYGVAPKATVKARKSK